MSYASDFYLKSEKASAECMLGRWHYKKICILFKTQEATELYFLIIIKKKLYRQP